MPTGIYKHKKYTKEMCENISKSLKGKKKSEEARKNMSLGKKGKKFTEEHKKNMSKGIKNNLPKTAFKKGYTPWNKGKHIWKNGNHPRGMLGKKYSKERLNKTRENWKNPKFRESMLNKIFKHRKLKPNKPEMFLNDLIQKNNLPFKYVGDGKIRIDGFNPDFMCNPSKKIIEIFGEYYHNLPKVKERDKRRLESYKKYGFETLIIWDYELKNPNEVLNKINLFSEIKKLKGE